MRRNSTRTGRRSKARRPISWLSALSREANHALIQELALSHAASISDDGLRQSVIAGITSNDLRNLCDIELRYEHLSVNDALNARQALAFFTKRQDLRIPGVDPKKVAYRKFLESESRCSETNEIFRKRAEGKFSFSPCVERVLHTARRKIALILGEIPEVHELKLRFGPGATTQVKKSIAHPLNKLRARESGWHCSEGLWSSGVARLLLDSMPGLFPMKGDGSFKLSLHLRAGRLDFVRKTLKTDRAIMVEPTLNTMIQLALGDWMADRLRVFGVDISDQSYNQRLALQGSLMRDLATIDLSSASDLIATLLVEDLVPVEWYWLLDACRSTHFTWQDSDDIPLEKFSSMGNGFTFPLETLIFYSLAEACRQESGSIGAVTAYGDDIVVPCGAVNTLFEVFNAVGFTVNTEKSYYGDSPFRESCGADYLRGIDVRPSYVKDLLTYEALFTLHNQYVRRNDAERAEFIRQAIPVHLQIFGPDGYGDGHLIDTAWEGRRHKRWRDGWSGRVFDTFVRKSPKKAVKLLPGDLYLPTYSIYAAGPAKAPARGTPQRSIEVTPEYYNPVDLAFSRFLDAEGGGSFYEMQLPTPNKGWYCYGRTAVYTLA